MKTSTLAPGLLVSLKTTVRGNVKYNTKELEADHVREDGSRKARWEGERIVELPDEHERSVKARSAARACITGVCSASSFGLLCRDDKVEQLRLAIADAQRIVDAFNAEAKLTRIGMFILTGRIAADDAEAARAIANEARELIEEMGAAVSDMDVAAIRKAATKAKAIGQVLTPAAQERVQAAVDAARATATKIAAAGETAAIAIDLETFQALSEARTMFLDLEDAKPVEAPDEPGRAVDYEAPAPAINVMTGEPSRAIDFGD
jgi:hypothetical protein